MVIHVREGGILTGQTKGLAVAGSRLLQSGALLGLARDVVCRKETVGVGVGVNQEAGFNCPWLLLVNRCSYLLKS